MSSVYEKRGVWYVAVKDPMGRRRLMRTNARNRTEAKGLARELEVKFDRQRRGLEPMTPPASTVGQLVEIWWQDHGRHLLSPSTGHLRKRLDKEFGSVSAGELTAGRIAAWLRSLQVELSPRTINGLRALLGAVFKNAIARQLWIGPSPVDQVKRFKVPKRLPEFLRFDEVVPTLEQIPAHLRPIYATAVFTALRRGELLALQVIDIDLQEGLLSVRRSLNSLGKIVETTKGKHADLVPIAEQLRPFLLVAIERARKLGSKWLFPNDEGQVRSREARLDVTLRRAMANAGLAAAWSHVCRSNKCRAANGPIALEAPNDEQRICPKCGRKLWAKAIPRHVRFHDLRHTTATLLLKSKVPLAIVQRILRHASPEITSEVYGHLEVDDLREGLAALRFQGLPVERTPAEAKAAVSGADPQAEAPAEAPPASHEQTRESATRALPAVEEGEKSKAPDRQFPEEDPGPSDGRRDWIRTSDHLHPKAPGTPSAEYQAVANPRNYEAIGPTGVHPVADRTPQSATRALPEKSGARLLLVKSSPVDRLLSVDDVATRLGLSTATVYKLIHDGELGSALLRGQFRVSEEALASYVSASSGGRR